MSYSDLTDNIHVNIKTIKLFGIEVATYWALLTQIALQVVRKETYDPETGYFTLNRGYVAERIGLTCDDQTKCDAKLAKLQLLQVCESDVNKIRLDVKTWAALITEDDPDTLANAVKSLKKAKGSNKKEYAIAALKNTIREAEPDVRAKLESWVEVVYERTRLTKGIIALFEDNLTKYTDRKEVKLKFIEVAMTFGYYNFDWAKERYEKTMKDSLGKSASQIANMTSQPVQSKQPVVLDKNNMF